jgi:hypothetical protein
MRKGPVAVVLGLALLALGAVPSHAALQLLLGKKFLVKDPGVATSRKVVASAKETASLATIIGNPTVDGGTLRILANGTTGSDQTFDLPAAGWSALGTIGYKFLGSAVASPVKKVLLKKSTGGTFLLKAVVKGSISLVPPNTGTDGGIELILGGGDIYCVGFGGAAGGTIGGNNAKVFKVALPTTKACAGVNNCPPTVARAKVIAAANELIDGALSRGRLGDVLLYNDQIQLVIQQPGRAMFDIGPYGGNIIDADRQRCDVGERDNFEEFTSLINLENTANYTSVTILNDGTNGQPAVVRATGPDDLIDYINASSVVADFGFTFPPSADDRNLPITVQTDYTLEPGNPWVKVETTLTNTDTLNPLSIFMGEIASGSGQVEMFLPQYAFGEPLITSPCPVSTYKDCAAGAAACDTCDFVAWSGEDDAAGVSYGLVHGINASTAFDTDGVSVPLYGVQALLVLIGIGTPNYTMAAAGNPGDAVTLTRYFVVGDGSVGAVVDARNAIRGVTKGTLTGTVTSGGSPVADADVAVLGPPNAGYTTYNVVDHFRTAADGTYRGTLPPGSYTVRVNKDGRLAGAPNPANVTVTAATTTTQDFTLPDEGRLVVNVTDENDDPIPAKVQLVGFDPNPPLDNKQTILTVSNLTSVFGAEVSQADGLPFGVAAVAFADKNGTTGTVAVDPGSYQLSVSHGPRYSASLQAVTITAGSTNTVDVQLARVIDTPGFITGDFHVHAIASPDSEVTNEERVATMIADGMDFFTPSDHDFRTDFTPTIAAMGVGGLISVAPSAEITTFDYGHYNSWPVTIDGSVNGGSVDHGRAGVAPGMDFPSLGSYGLTPAEIIAAAHADPRPNLVQINHVGSFFSTSGLDIDTAEGGTGPPQSHTPASKARLDPAVANFYADTYEALEVWIGTDGRNGSETNFVRENLGDWVNLLNQGKIHSGVASSDTHHKRNTQMNARTYVASAVTDPALLGTTANSDALAASVVAGKAIGTNAPFVTITAFAASTGEDAGLEVGDDTVMKTTDGAVDVTVTVKSPLWAEFDKVQILVNAAPQPYDHDAKPATRDRYRTLPSNTCSVASGCYEITPTVSVVDDFPSIPDAKHLEATAVLNLTGLAQDVWIVALVRGTDGVSKPLFPVQPNSLKQSTNSTLADLTDGNLGEDGMLALSFTNPLYVEADNNDDGWTAPGVLLSSPSGAFLD